MRSGGFRLARPAEAALVGLGIAMLHLLLTVHEPFSVDDQGLQYLLARTWARGESLFANWDVLYPIGRYSWYGSLMSILGEDIWVLRLGGSCLVGAAGALFFATLRRLGSLGLGLGVSFAPLLIAKPQAPTILASAAVVSAALYVASVAAISRRALLLLAMLAGALYGWREDSAILATLVVLVAVFRRRRTVEALLPVTAGLLIGFGWWLLVMLLQGESVGDFVGHVAHRVGFLFTRVFEPTMDHFHVPQLSELNSPKDVVPLFVPLLIVLPALTYAAILGREAWRWRQERTARWLAVAAGLAGMAYLPQFAWERPDLVHFFSHLPVLVVTTAAVATGWSPPWRRRAVVLLPVLLGLTLLARVVEVELEGTASYPTPAAAAIGAAIAGGETELPPWAGLPRASGETLIVLGFGPGWYVLEGYPAGTRFLSTMSRQLSSEEARDALRADLARPTVRWVIFLHGAVHGGFLPADVGEFFTARYRQVGASWKQWELWEPIE